MKTKKTKKKKTESKSKRYYSLPSGKTTTSVNIYLKEWKKLRDRLEKEFDLITISCDPSFIVRKKDNWNSFEIPLGFAKEIFQKLDDNKYQIDLMCNEFNKSLKIAKDQNYLKS